MKPRIPSLKQNGLIVLVIAGLCSASGCRTRTHYAALPIPFDRNELVDSWIGFNDRDATCYKLILQAGGQGVLYSQFQEGTSATNKISNWRIHGNVIRCEFQHDDSPTSPALLTCGIKKTLLAATLTGVGEWKENVLFRRSQFMEQSLSKAKTLEPSAGAAAAPHKR
jgi:hypothetical protein